MLVVDPDQAGSVRQHPRRFAAADRNRPRVPGPTGSVRVSCVKAIRDPSGVKTGAYRVPASLVSRTASPPDSNLTYTSPRQGNSESERMNVTILPSGERLGSITESEKSVSWTYSDGDTRSWSGCLNCHAMAARIEHERPDWRRRWSPFDAASMQHRVRACSMRAAARCPADPFQVGAHVGGRLIACLAIFLEQPTDDTLEVLRDLRVPLPNRRRRL